MTRLTIVPALLLASVLGACDDSFLDVTPVDELAEDVAIVDEESAMAALMGAYSGIQDDFYYGGDYVMWSETLTDNVEHTGTFEEFADGDLLFLTADNGSITGMWENIYDAINRANILIERIPQVEDLSQAQQDEIIGQAHALRALAYFDLVRGYGGVPIVLSPPTDLDDAALIERSPTSEVYDQVETDLATAEDLVSAMSNDDRSFVTPGFIDALQAQVALYQEDWAGAAAAARDVVESGDYALVEDYGALFTAGGAPTSEDIFRVIFTATDEQFLGHYYRFAGRFEIGATEDIYGLYDPVEDERWAATFGESRTDGIEMVKYPIATGGVHIIRYADVLLILAEALAQQGGLINLTEAVEHLNEVRTRAGEDPYTCCTLIDDLQSQQDVLNAIYLERRLELAFEGEYWFDLVRTGRAAAVLGESLDAHEVLWPIPVSELDVAPNLTQNPGY